MVDVAKRPKKPKLPARIRSGWDCTCDRSFITKHDCPGCKEHAAHWRPLRPLGIMPNMDGIFVSATVQTPQAMRTLGETLIELSKVHYKTEE